MFDNKDNANEKLKTEKTDENLNIQKFAIEFSTEESAQVVDNDEPPKNSTVIAVVFGVVLIIIAIVLVIVFSSGKRKITYDSEKTTKFHVTESRNNEVTITAPTQNTLEKPYEDIVVNYMKDVFNGDYLSATKYCLVNGNEELKVLAKKYPSDYQIIRTGLEEIYEDECQEKVHVASSEDVYNYYGKLFKSEYTDCNIEIVSSDIVGLNEVYDDYCDRLNGSIWLDNISKEYSSESNIDEVYRVNVNITMNSTDTSGQTITNNSYFYVVKYKGDWKIVSDPILDF